MRAQPSESADNSYLSNLKPGKPDFIRSNADGPHRNDGGKLRSTAADARSHRAMTWNERPCHTDIDHTCADGNRNNRTLLLHALQKVLRRAQKCLGNAQQRRERDHQRSAAVLAAIQNQQRRNGERGSYGMQWNRCQRKIPKCGSGNLRKFRSGPAELGEDGLRWLLIRKLWKRRSKRSAMLNATE